MQTVSSLQTPLGREASHSPGKQELDLIDFSCRGDTKTQRAHTVVVRPGDDGLVGFELILTRWTSFIQLLFSFGSGKETALHDDGQDEEKKS